MDVTGPGDATPTVVRRYINADGDPVNERGDVLTGVAPLDSDTFAMFCELERRGLADQDFRLRDDDGGSWLEQLSGLAETMDDAGEAEEARARISQVRSVLTAPTGTGPEYEEARRLRDEALALPSDPTERRETARRNRALMLALAEGAPADEAVAIRRESGDLLPLETSSEPDAEDGTA